MGIGLVISIFMLVFELGIEPCIDILASFRHRLRVSVEVSSCLCLKISIPDLNVCALPNQYNFCLYRPADATHNNGL